jgi:hypothetical protein
MLGAFLRNAGVSRARRGRVGGFCLRFLLVALTLTPTLAVADCGAQFIPCWACLLHSPPHDLATGFARHVQRFRPEKHVLGRFQRWPAFLLTIFKRGGIQGWHDYSTEAEMEGVVIQGAHSTDGMETVDFHIDHLKLDGAEQAGARDGFIRVEIFPCAFDRAPRPHCSYRVQGRLRWDGDGWFEIHPLSKKALVLLGPDACQEKGNNKTP